MQKNTIPLKKNSIYDVTIDGWSSDGSGVAHIDGYGVFVPRTIKGERWTIKIVKVTNSKLCDLWNSRSAAGILSGSDYTRMRQLRKMRRMSHRPHDL